MDILEKFLNEQQWREKKAQQYSSGLGSLPYSFQEQFDLRAPLLLDMFRRQDMEALKGNKKWEEMQAPDYAPQRYYLNEGINLNEERKRTREKYGV